MTAHDRPDPSARPRRTWIELWQPMIDRLGAQISTDDPRTGQPPAGDRR